MFLTSPSLTLVTEPVAVISLTSPATNPSPVTVTSGLVSGLPSYCFVADLDVRVTFLGVIVSLPSVTSNVTFVKSALVLLKFSSVRPIAYPPSLTSVPLAEALPSNLMLL